MISQEEAKKIEAELFFMSTLQWRPKVFNALINNQNDILELQGQVRTLHALVRELRGQLDELKQQKG